MTLPDYFAELARYHAWATQRLLIEHLALLDDAQWFGDCGLFFGSVHGTVSHLLVTDEIWWSRFALGESPRTALDAQPHAARAPLVAALLAAVQRWQPWAATLSAAQLGGELHYTRANGESMRLPFTPTLGHVFNHATHHRGQLTAALTALGLQAPELDWVRFLQIQGRVTP
ncbi:DinB family protein [Xenophilus arseniciresistens]|uniref:DinB family protein n=1 Tax=Xenophilus arseniciresistens TaxID=1283306 RepID=A0AAE3N9E4_9BURK|nr:DinB family protein [Xenophilus arseniciresistens]MDA7416964.1 DinB family protein [Xenophilus arseniciresistens]